MARKSIFKCGRCKRTFKMAAHLARHMTTHGVEKTTKRKYAKRAVGSRTRVDRPTGVVARLGLRELGLEQLTEVMTAVRLEASRKLAKAEAALR